jgi:hypothetical protein
MPKFIFLLFYFHYSYYAHSIVSGKFQYCRIFLWHECYTSLDCTKRDTFWHWKYKTAGTRAFIALLIFAVSKIILDCLFGIAGATNCHQFMLINFLKTFIPVSTIWISVVICTKLNLYQKNEGRLWAIQITQLQSPVKNVKKQGCKFEVKFLFTACNFVIILHH